MKKKLFNQETKFKITILKQPQNNTGALKVDSLF